LNAGTYYYGVSALYPGAGTVIESGYATVNITITETNDAMEDFETGDFSKFDWQFSNNEAWTMETENPYAGIFSAKTPLTQDKDTTQLIISLIVPQAGEISFYKRVSSEYNWDYFRFFIDDELMGQWSGEVEWSFESFEVESGFHTFKWSYEKDWFAISGEDCAYLDNIILPGAVGQSFLPPENLFSEVNETTVTLEWDYPGFNEGNPPPSGLLGYNLTINGVFSGFTSLTTYSEDSLSAGEYQYCITAVYADGESDLICTDFEIGTSFYNLGGTIMAAGASIDEGFAYLYQIEDGQIIDVFVDFVTEYGYYDFPQLEAGKYILKAELSPNSPLYNQYIPTYYGDVPNWTNATLINLQANTWNADVNMIAIGSSAYGNGLIAGKIKKSGKGFTSYVSGVEILLSDENNNVIGVGYTDENGHYQFDDIAFATYFVRVEITGLQSTNVKVSLDEENPGFDNLNFVVNSEEIALSVNTWNYSVHSIGDVFPNPVTNHANLSFISDQQQKVLWEVYDVTGKKVLVSQTNVVRGNNQISFKTIDIKAGVYFIKLHSDNQYITKKFIKL
jgi:hypothetical protein